MPGWSVVYLPLSVLLDSLLMFCLRLILFQVRQIQFEFNREALQWQARALEALQQAAEDYLVHLMEDA